MTKMKGRKNKLWKTKIKGCETCLELRFATYTRKKKVGNIWREGVTPKKTTTTN
jgi:hypothetical protein